MSANLKKDRSAPSPRDGSPTAPILIAVDGADPEGLWASLVETLGDRTRAALVLNPNAGDLAQETDAENGLPVIVAKGTNAVKAACNLARARALVVVEGIPPKTCALAKKPTLIVRGRQSSKVSHRAAVIAFEGLPAGRIVELENCGNKPERDQPTALATAIWWFVENLIQLEATVNAK